MNRSIAAVGILVSLAGIVLVAFPIIVMGGEQLDPEQVVGFLLAPLGLFVVLIAAIAVDPRRTTIAGTFGNPEETVPGEPRSAEPTPRFPFRPSAPVYCRYCRTIILADLSRCPRCSRARGCRTCGRPLGQILDRPTCPTCARPEPFCNCPILPSPSGSQGRWRAEGTTR